MTNQSIPASSAQPTCRRATRELTPANSFALWVASASFHTYPSTHLCQKLCAVGGVGLQRRQPAFGRHDRVGADEAPCLCRSLHLAVSSAAQGPLTPQYVLPRRCCRLLTVLVTAAMTMLLLMLFLLMLFLHHTAAGIGFMLLHCATAISSCCCCWPSCLDRQAARLNLERLLQHAREGTQQCLCSPRRCMHACNHERPSAGLQPAWALLEQRERSVCAARALSAKKLRSSSTRSVTTPPETRGSDIWGAFSAIADTRCCCKSRASHKSLDRSTLG